MTEVPIICNIGPDLTVYRRNTAHYSKPQPVVREQNDSDSMLNKNPLSPLNPTIESQTQTNPSSLWVNRLDWGRDDRSVLKVSFWRHDVYIYIYLKMF